MNRLTNTLLLAAGMLIGCLAIVTGLIPGGGTTAHARAAAAQKPNILFIMGDDIGWMQPSIYHRGLMVGETPNIDRIGNEGAIFMDAVLRVAMLNAPQYFSEVVEHG